MFFHYMDKRLKIILLLLAIGFIIGGFYYFITTKEKVPVISNEGVTIVDKPEIDNVLTPPVVVEEREPQDKVLKRYKLVVNKIIEKGSKLDYIVSIGAGDAVQESMIEINEGTIFYDAIRKTTGGPNMVLEDMEVVFIGTGLPQIKDLKASLIVIGGTSNIKYSKVKSLNKDGDTNGYIIELEGNNEYLSVSEDLEIRNGITGALISDIRLISEGTGLIYNVKPDFSQESFGLLYEAEEVVLIHNP